MSKKIEEAVEVHQELNQKLFDGTELKQEVKDRLLEIANTFIEKLDFPLNVADIRFLGSNASYNYNEYSDIDLHIISNFDLVYIDKNILQQLYNASKNSFNNNHNITIKGIPVEIYIEDMNSMNATNGSYSLLNDEWVKFPEPIEYEIPDYSKELNGRKSEISQALLSTNKEEIECLINDIYLARKDGLATEGEASIGNLVFKELRNLDMIQQLRDRYNELESEELTLENKSAEIDVQSANSTLKESVEEEASKDGQIAEKEKEYREYIDTHIANVQKAYDRIIKQFAEDELTANQLKQLEANLKEHDKDKNIPFMFDAYRRNHCPINDEEKEAAEEDYGIAWEYHKNINPHHWEYWLNSNMEFAEDIDENAMKLAYLEMLCDWLSFGFRKEDTSATGEPTEFKSWYDENKDTIKIHPQLEKWFSGLISQVLDYIEQEGKSLYESKETKPLTNIKNCCIIEQNDVNNSRKVGENEMDKLQEMNYTEFKKENSFKFDYRVVVPLLMKQEDEFDTYEDERGNDIEMDYDVDSLIDSFSDSEQVIDDLFNDEDFLKDIFPTVGLGRVYPELISLEETKFEFNIGFSDVKDPVEEGNDISLNENELKEQIADLVEAVLNEAGVVSAKQSYETYSGYKDEDDEPIYDTEYSDDNITFSLNVNGDIQIKENLTESKKLEESSMSRVLQWMTEYQVAFITGFRNGNTKSTNQDRNYELKMDLQQDLEKSDMYFIKVNGAYPEEKGDGLVQVFEETFAVVNDKYIGGEFKDIMVALANKYNQDGVLITYPPEDGKQKIEDNITSVEYDKNGNKTASYKGFSISQYDKFKDKNPTDYEYYTQVGNKKLSFNNRQEYTESKDEPRKDWRPSGRIGAQQRHTEALKYIENLK